LQLDALERRTQEATLALIKPDAVASHQVGRIITRIEEAKFRIVAMRMTRLSLPEAQRFYSAHQAEPFYDALCDFMTSGPSIALILESPGFPDVVGRWRTVIGATDWQRASPGSIRADFGASANGNAVHGSDSAAAAAAEIAFFFPVDVTEGVTRG